MSDKRFAIGITIGAAMAGGFSRTTTGVKRELDAVGKAVEQIDRKRRTIEKFQINSSQVQKLGTDLSTAQQKLKTLQQTLRQNPGDSGIKKEVAAAGVAVGRLSSMLEKQRRQLGESRSALSAQGVSVNSLKQQYDRLGSSIDVLSQKQKRVNDLMSRRDQLRSERGELMGQSIAPLAVLGGAGFAAKKYADLEEATTDLKVAMLTAKGQVSQHFDKIAQEAIVLGNALPGTTKDFMMSARALVEQGMKYETIANGGLQASSYLGVLLKMDQAGAAELTAKLREAHGLKDEELPQAADVVQRARFGFGLKSDQLYQSMAYSSSDMNAMGMTGIENMKKFMAIQGMAANVGLEGSSFGTNFSMMLKRLPQLDSRLGRKSKEAKEVQGILQEHDIKLNFYDDKGKFAGFDNMVKELAKLNSLSQIEQSKALNRLFGVEAGRPAQILVQQGLAGYEAAQQRMTDQASLQQRVNLSLTTFKNRLEALGGTTENLLAATGAPIGEALKPVLDKMNDIIGGTEGKGGVAGFVQNHQKTVGVVGGTVAGAAALSLAAIGVRLGVNLLKSGFTSMALGAAQLGKLPGLGGVVSKIPGVGKVAGKVGAAAGMLGVQKVFVVNMGMGGMGGGAANFPAGGKGGASATAAGKGGIISRLLNKGRSVVAGTVMAGGVLAEGAVAGKALGAVGKVAKFAGKGIAPLALASNAWSAGEIALDDKKSSTDKKVAFAGLGGSMAGMAAGAAVGSIVPVVGTLLGGIVGGVLGSLGGEKLGTLIGEAVFRRSEPGKLPAAGSKPGIALPGAGIAAPTTIEKKTSMEAKYTLNVNGVGMAEVNEMIKNQIAMLQQQQETRMRAAMHDGGD